MAKTIRAQRVNHLNLVLPDFDTSVAHFRDLYGAEFLIDLPNAEFHACLIEIGRVIIEIFVPPAFLLWSRLGPHYLGIEYQADMDEVREVIAAHGMRIVRDIGVALHTHPADGFGVAFEFYAGSFHDNEPPVLQKTVKPQAYWRDEHPLGITGLKAYTLAVHDIEAASRFLQSFLGAAPAYEAPRPAIGARAVGLQVADCVVELLAPVGEGPLIEHLKESGQGIRSIVFGTRDLDQARRGLEGRGVALAPGAAPDSFAVPTAANLGVLFEFSA